jgi:hypothetical protein
MEENFHPKQLVWRHAFDRLVLSTAATTRLPTRYCKIPAAAQSAVQSAGAIIDDLMYV